MESKKFISPQYSSLFAGEEAILKFWQENQIFKKSLEMNQDKPVFSFYDGPPFITGMPHYATLLPSIAKDIIPRYQTMKGHYVRRIWGWDTHGLPAETQVEKKLGLKSKRDIETFGIEKFIIACREYVSEVSDAWSWYIDHIGRWTDLSTAYRTDNLKYMETVIWLFRQLYDKELIYQGRRVSLYCPRCATPISKFETTMDDDTYRMVDDEAVTVKFRLKNDDVSLLAWTTTPWTLPANLGLALNPKAEYVRVSDGKEDYIMAHQALERYREFDLEIKETFKGDQLVGESYEPIFQFFPTNEDTDYKIYPAEFVSMEEGTGIVHIAPGFGEDDTKLGEQVGMSLLETINDEGHFVDAVTPWKGQYYKKANTSITEDLISRGILFSKNIISHSYPHCWRCGTPLIYKSQLAWYCRIDPLRQELVKANKDINWIPEHLGSKRFVYNLENAPDWCVSRSRYWGTPIPVWQTDDGELIVPESVAQIEEMSGQKITDLHRPAIDNIVLTTKTGKKAQRVKDVLDVWFESGAMPYAQDHYPFESTELFEKHFPADFIIEYTGQLRGWFYYLHVLAHALKGQNAFKSAAVTGVLMGNDGRKMSKSYGNYPDPKIVMEKYGAEALRLYFMGSKIMAGEDLAISEEDIREQSRLLNVLHNAFKYFQTYATLHSFTPGQEHSPTLLDQWIKVRLEQFVSEYSQALDNFDFVVSTKAIRPFIEDLSTWYIRRSRDRFVSGDLAALSTLYTVLLRFATAVAPTLPFTAEIIYQALNLGDIESVHMHSFPLADIDSVFENEELLKGMESVRGIASFAHMLRSEGPSIPVRQPLTKLILGREDMLMGSSDLMEILKDEINVKSVEFSETAGDWRETPFGQICLDKTITPELEEEGRLRELIRILQDARKKSGLQVGQEGTLRYYANNDWVNLIEKYLTQIQEQTSLTKIIQANSPDGLERVAQEDMYLSVNLT